MTKDETVVGSPDDDGSNEIMITGTSDIVAAPEGNVFLDLVHRRRQLIEMALPAALAATKPSEWMDIGGHPHLKEGGVEKVRLLFGISGKNVRYTKDESKDEKGMYYIWTCFIDICLPGSDEVLTAVGTASSRKQFYAKRGNEWKKLSEISEENIKKHAWTNAMHNGVTSVLGFKGAEWKDLEDAKAIAFDRKKVDRVDFKDGTGKKAEAKTGTKSKGKSRGKAETKGATKAKSVEAKPADRKTAITAFNDLMDYMTQCLGFTETEVLEKYLPFKNPDKDTGLMHPILERVQQFKSVKAIAWLEDAAQKIRDEEDLSGFDAFMQSTDDDMPEHE